MRFFEFVSNTANVIQRSRERVLGSTLYHQAYSDKNPLPADMEKSMTEAALYRTCFVFFKPSSAK